MLIKTLLVRLTSHLLLCVELPVRINSLIILLCASSSIISPNINAFSSFVKGAPSSPGNLTKALPKSLKSHMSSPTFTTRGFQASNTSLTQAPRALSLGYFSRNLTPISFRVLGPSESILAMSLHLTSSRGVKTLYTLYYRVFKFFNNQGSQSLKK